MELKFGEEYTLKFTEEGIIINAPFKLKHWRDSVNYDKDTEILKFNGELKQGHGVDAQMHEGETVLANFEPEVIVPLSYIEELIRENAEMKSQQGSKSTQTNEELKYHANGIYTGTLKTDEPISTFSGNEMKRETEQTFISGEGTVIAWDEVGKNNPDHTVIHIKSSCNCKDTDIKHLAETIAKKLKNKGIK